MFATTLSKIGFVVALVILPLGNGRFSANAGEADQYDVAAIPPDLKKDADLVIRQYEHIFRVESRNRAKERVRLVYTILKPEARDYGRIIIAYDKFRKIKSLKGELRDASGRLVRKLKKKNVQDYSAIAGYSLYDDSRVRMAEFYYDRYPYTVEFEYELDHKGLISYPTWAPQSTAGAVEVSRFEISVPEEMDVRYYTYLLEAEPVVRKEKGRKLYQWQATNLPALEFEPYGPPRAEQIARVLTAPVEFEIEGRAGRMTTWREFGAWNYMLNAGKDELPPEEKKVIDELLRGARTDREKVERLYTYLQSTTRYVSVQLGIGGWEPFDATYVTERRYGDCKALSNYLLALLKYAGITAYTADVRSGSSEPDVIAAFPSNQFNHVIVMVPVEADTIWLEATSQTMPFGHIGAANQDRNVLLITPEGGRLVRTPASRSVDNVQLRHARVELLPNGDATAEVRMRYSGTRQDRVRGALAQSTGRDRENWLRNEIDLPAFRLLRADFSHVDAGKPDVILEFSVTIPKLASRAGKRLFITPNLMEQRRRIPDPVGDRRFPVQLRYAYLNVDSINYKLPADYRVEAMPEPVELDAFFGSYRSRTTLTENGELLYVRRFEIEKNKFPAEHYEEFRDFIRKVVKADKKQVVLVRR
jgi:transglutaminase-like putative cysteine protease